MKCYHRQLSSPFATVGCMNCDWGSHLTGCFGCCLGLFSWANTTHFPWMYVHDQNSECLQLDALFLLSVSLHPFILSTQYRGFHPSMHPRATGGSLWQQWLLPATLKLTQSEGEFLVPFPVADPLREWWFTSGLPYFFPVSCLNVLQSIDRHQSLFQKLKAILPSLERTFSAGGKDQTENPGGNEGLCLSTE